MNNKINELKNKLIDQKIDQKIKKNMDNNVEIGNKEKLKHIKKLNKSPKGFKKINNKPGNILEIINLSKHYLIGKSNFFTAFKNANFSIKKGEITVIIGPSGSGKSSLLNVISGLDRPTNGKIVINNQNISAFSNKELTNFRRKNIGFIFQSYNLLPELTAHDNVEIGRVLQKDATRRINIEDIFEQIDMKDQKNINVKNLSGGQQQRVSIARAIAKNPLIIFADEPTGALDSITSKKVIDLLKKINRKYKTTIILVTHDETITSIANQIIHIEDGVVSIRK